MQVIVVPGRATEQAACMQVDVFFKYYPKRLSQVLLVDAPWVFRPIWATIRPTLGKYAKLVSFISKEELCPQYFKPGTLPDAFKA